MTIITIDRPMRRSLWPMLILGCVLLIAPMAAPALAQSGICVVAPIDRITGSARGPNAAAIQAGVDTFRADLGNDNGDGGSYPTGRREVDWDDVPDEAAAPNTLTTNTRYLARGLVLSSGAASDVYQVSADASAAPGTLPRFGNIDPSYANTFQTFSGERLFTPVGTNVIEVRFVVPSTGKPATVRRFAAVFADVDTPSSTRVRANTYMQFYGRNGSPLDFLDGGDPGPLPIDAFNNGLTFEGGAVVQGCEPIARVRIVLGTAALAPGVVETGRFDTPDLVALDNFIYSEPRPIDHDTLDFDGDGATDIAIYRPSNGGWYVLNSGNHTVTAGFFGQPGDMPVPADYTGDGVTDIAVFRPTTRQWFAPNPFLPPGSPPRAVAFGAPGDIPMTPFDFDEDGRVDLVVWRPSDGGFYISPSSNPYPEGGYAIYWGQSGDVPLKKE